MTDDSNETQIAILNERVNSLISDRKADRAELATLKAELARMHLEKSEASSQRDRNIRWLAYVLMSAVLTNLVGAENAIKMLGLIGTK